MRMLSNADLLDGIRRAFPELTLKNNGYEYLSKEVRKENKEIISGILDLIRDYIPSATKFHNFYPRKDGEFDVRIEYCWDDDIYYYGVGYFLIKDFVGPKANEINNKTE